jgi:hypothetical protein
LPPVDEVSHCGLFRQYTARFGNCKQGRSHRLRTQPSNRESLLTPFFKGYRNMWGLPSPLFIRLSFERPSASISGFGWDPSSLILELPSDR